MCSERLPGAVMSAAATDDDDDDAALERPATAPAERGRAEPAVPRAPRAALGASKALSLSSSPSSSAGRGRPPASLVDGMPCHGTTAAAVLLDAGAGSAAAPLVGLFFHGAAIDGIKVRCVWTKPSD